MAKITKVYARQVFDSRGNPTIESEVFLDDGNRAFAIVPSGASTGTHEAFELRDVENKKYLGKGVSQAVEKVNVEISKALVGVEAEDQKKVDQILIDLDGTLVPQVVMVMIRVSVGMMYISKATCMTLQSIFRNVITFNRRYLSAKSF